MSGSTGGIQGQSGTLFGFAYQPGSWQDNLIEAYSGTHDMIGGRLSGLYDSQGNTLRKRSPTEKFLHDRWSEMAILPATPFAMAEFLSPDAWNAILILLRGMK